MVRRRDATYNWQTWPQSTPLQERDLRKRVLQAETQVGIVASVHLDKVNMSTGENASLARSVYTWVFDCHDIVMGDCNSEWQYMIGAEDPTRPPNSKASAKRVASIKAGAWVSADTHACAYRPSYLVGATQENDDHRAIKPKAFDLIVVTRPRSVKLLEKQPGRTFPPQGCKLPRTYMEKVRWPSDHTSVVGEVKAGTATLNVATWNCADPHYFEQFWPASGFGFEWQPEDERLDDIERHVVTLLESAEVVGLQEVPVRLVQRLVVLATGKEYQAQWVAAPSSKDTEWYERTVGRRGCSTEAGSRDALSSLLSSLPAGCGLPHDMLLVRYSALKEPPTALERSSLATATSSEEEVGTVELAQSVSVLAVEKQKTEDLPENWDDDE